MKPHHLAALALIALLAACGPLDGPEGTPADEMSSALFRVERDDSERSARDTEEPSASLDDRSPDEPAEITDEVQRCAYEVVRVDLDSACRACPYAVGDTWCERIGTCEHSRQCVDRQRASTPCKGGGSCVMDMQLSACAACSI